MEDILANAWFVGIITSIISGLIVFFVTRHYISKDINKADSQSLYEAKMEVLYAIRPSISEGNLPDREIINSLIKASMMKYEINKKHYFTVEELADTLIKEVMDSSFISAKEKITYCKNLLEIKKPEESALILEKYDEGSEYVSPIRARLSLTLSLTMGLLACVITLMISKFFEQGFYGTESGISISLRYLINLALPTILILISFIAILSIVNLIISDKQDLKEESLNDKTDFETIEDE